jgi:hydroxymethylglutaryl-CoA reductase
MGSRAGGVDVVSISLVQRREAIAELVAEGIRKGHVEINDLHESGIQLRMTPAGHQALDKYLEETRWDVSVVEN